MLYSYKKKYSINFGFIDQGPGSIGISGDGEIIFGDSINLKSNTFMEVSGGLKIGSYFHTGRGLTIFTTNHNYRKPKFIPYDKEKIIGSVEIGGLCLVLVQMLLFVQELGLVKAVWLVQAQLFQRVYQITLFVQAIPVK